MTIQPFDDPAHTPELRASDADRQRVAELLNAAYVDGRLDLAEHGERTEALWAARTHGDLDLLTRDLGFEGLPPRGAEMVPVNPALTAPSTRLTAILSDAKREGAWIVPARLEASSIMGDIKLDMRTALFSSRRVDIDLSGVMADITLWIPDGVSVEDETTQVMSDLHRDGLRPTDPEAPVIVLHGFLLMTDVHVRGSDYRTLGQRLGFRK